MRSTSKIKKLKLGNNVVAIMDHAFTDNSSIEEVDLSCSLVLSSIGKNAFERSSLLSFHYTPVSDGHDKIRIVDGYGLNKSNALQRITFDSGYEAIAPYAFVNCEPSLTSVQFPETLTSVGKYAFAES